MPGGPDHQHVRRCLQVAAGAELVDQLTIDTGLRVEIEVVQRRRRRETREPQPADETTGEGGVDLDREEPLEGRCDRQLIIECFVQHAWQRLGAGVEFQHRQVGLQRLVERRLRCRRWRSRAGRDSWFGHVSVSFRWPLSRMR